jgi:polar amino acid transport system permease protein
MPELFDLLAIGPTGWGDEILSGAWLTIRLALATLPFGLVLGFLVALAKRSYSLTLRAGAETFTTIFRGCPSCLRFSLFSMAGSSFCSRLRACLPMRRSRQTLSPPA